MLNNTSGFEKLLRYLLGTVSVNSQVIDIMIPNYDRKYAVQRIEVYFNYIGKFENELTKQIEPTEQEMIQMREEIEEVKKEKSRAYHRAYSKEYRANKKLQAMN